MKTKVCTKCGIKKPLSGFANAPDHVDGKEGSCRQCRQARRREWRAINVAHFRAKDAAWTRANPEKVRVRNARNRATFRGWCKAIYAAIKQRCDGRGLQRVNHVYAGLPYCSWDEFWEWAQTERAEWEFLVNRAKETGKRRDRPSVDRLSAHCGVGYVPGNMRFAAHGDNCTKAILQRTYGRAAVSPYYIKEQ